MLAGETFRFWWTACFIATVSIISCSLQSRKPFFLLSYQFVNKKKIEVFAWSRPRLLSRLGFGEVFIKFSMILEEHCVACPPPKTLWIPRDAIRIWMDPIMSATYLRTLGNEFPRCACIKRLISFLNFSVPSLSRPPSTHMLFVPICCLLRQITEAVT